MIQQGQIYWVDFGEPQGSAPGYLRPGVVVQHDAYNRSRIRTTIVCALTTNLRLANAPGNVLLELGEANLRQASIVNVSQIYTVDKHSLGERIGKLSRRRLREVLDAIQSMFEPRRL